MNYFKIQILDGEKWTKQAVAQHEFTLYEPFKRGAFYANPSITNSHPEICQPLVFDVTKFHLYVDPISIPENLRDEVAETLQKYATIKVEELSKHSHSRRLASWLDQEQKDEILGWWFPFASKNRIARNSLFFVTDYKRSYPYGHMLGQVLHTIREFKEETTSAGVPTGGLEAYFNGVLNGKLGERKQLRSPLNQLETDNVIIPPQDGADVYLTVNPFIQVIAEEELEKGVMAAEAKGGWAVMLNPHTGEILALAQYPFFDTSHYQDFFNDPEKVMETKVKAATDPFEPGSIMKPITLSIALKANEELLREGKKIIFYPDEKVDTTRCIFPGRAHHPLVDVNRHKALNMYMAIQKSSNVYMAQIIERVINTMGDDWYRNALIQTFGFETKTEIQIPAETCGAVPKRGRIHPNGHPEWSLSTPYSLAMGYNILATSLQMLRAYAVFANGGYLVKPTLVKRVIKNEEIIFDNSLEMNKKRVLDSKIVAEVVNAMKFTTKPGGTGYLATIDGYTEAGKTGTAEKIVDGVYSKQHYISSFIGFTPVSSPCFVLAITIDEPTPTRLADGSKAYTGGKCAAPVFAAIAKRTLEYLGVPPDDPYGYKPPDKRFDPEKADWIKEMRELKFLYEQWNRP